MLGALLNLRSTLSDEKKISSKPLKDRTIDDINEVYDSLLKNQSSCKKRGTVYIIILLFVGVGGGIGPIFENGIGVGSGICLAIGIFAYYKSRDEERLMRLYKKMWSYIDEYSKHLNLMQHKYLSFNIISGHQSRYYPSEKSWTRSPAWAFEIPIDKFAGEVGYNLIELQCGSGGSHEEGYKLIVSATYLEANKQFFYIRKDKGTISLFLSARPEDLFKDLRGKGKELGQFKGMEGAVQYFNAQWIKFHPMPI